MTTPDLTPIVCTGRVTLFASPHRRGSSHVASVSWSYNPQHQDAITMTVGGREWVIYRHLLERGRLVAVGFPRHRVFDHGVTPMPGTYPSVAVLLDGELGDWMVTVPLVAVDQILDVAAAADVAALLDRLTSGGAR